jgi:hypothetical protein
MATGAKTYVVEDAEKTPGLIGVRMPFPGHALGPAPPSIALRPGHRRCRRGTGHREIPARRVSSVR